MARFPTLKQALDFYYSVNSLNDCEIDLLAQAVKEQDFSDEDYDNVVELLESLPRDLFHKDVYKEAEKLTELIVEWLDELDEEWEDDEDDYEDWDYETG